MPQPAQNVGSWSFNATWVQQHRPECVAAIGLIVLGWTRVEKQFAHTIAAIFGIKTFKAGGYGLVLDQILATVMRETDTNHARIKIVDAILKPALDGTALSDQWDGIADSLRKRARERNVVAHTEWAWSETEPEFVLQILKDGSIQKWNEADFANVFQRSRALEHELIQFQKDVVEAILNGTMNREVIRPEQIG